MCRRSAGAPSSRLVSTPRSANGSRAVVTQPQPSAPSGHLRKARSPRKHRQKATPTRRTGERGPLPEGARPGVELVRINSQRQTAHFGNGRPRQLCHDHPSAATAGRAALGRPLPAVPPFSPRPIEPTLPVAAQHYPARGKCRAALQILAHVIACCPAWAPTPATFCFSRRFRPAVNRIRKPVAVLVREGGETAVREPVAVPVGEGVKLAARNAIHRASIVSCRFTLPGSLENQVSSPTKSRHILEWQGVAKNGKGRCLAPTALASARFKGR